MIYLLLFGPNNADTLCTMYLSYDELIRYIYFLFWKSAWYIINNVYKTDKQVLRM